MANYVVIHTSTNKYVVYLTFKGVEENLPGDKFIRIHKSYIVAINKIKSIDNGEVTLENHQLSLSRHYKDEVMKRISSYVFKRNSN